MTTIVSLQVENVKRLKAVRIEPDGTGLVQITGRNAQGKTSVLDAIEMALGGGGSIPARPIRAGQSQARAVVDLGDIVVERVFKEGSSTLHVRNKDGAKFDKPQAMLDRLVGALTFDPLAFTRMKPAEQRQQLMQIAGLKFDDLDRERARAFESRTDVNRQLKAAQARLAAMPIISPAPERVDVAQLTSAYADAIRYANDRRAREAKIRECQNEIVTLEAQKAEIEKRIVAGMKALEEQVNALGAMPENDPEVYRVELANAAETNRKADAAVARVKASSEVESLAAESNNLTATIDELDEQKRGRIAAARLPIVGLSLDDSGVVFNGIPFEQASAAEQLRVSLAMAIASNPKLRVMLIRDGSLLDGDSLAVVEEMAKKHNAQVWMERVDDSGEVGVVIEDGEVAHVAVS